MSASAIEVSCLTKTFPGRKKALDDVGLSVAPGEMVALIGASGSGKSTLLRHIAGLVEADGRKGCEISVLGRAMQRDGRIARDARTIRSAIGMVFQQFNLVGRLSVLTNVLTGHLGRMPRWRGALALFTEDEKRAALEAMRRVGIDSHALHRGNDLSGGQQQRAAIARTLVQGAEVLIADEPIASLDPHSAQRVMDILAALNAEDGITVLVSLHQVDYALRYCPRTVALRDGRIVYDGPSAALTPDFLSELYGAESRELLLPSLDRGEAEAPMPRPRAEPVALREAVA